MLKTGSDAELSWFQSALWLSRVSNWRLYLQEPQAVLLAITLLGCWAQQAAPECSSGLLSTSILVCPGGKLVGVIEGRLPATPVSLQICSRLIWRVLPLNLSGFASIKTLTKEEEW